MKNGVTSGNDLKNVTIKYHVFISLQKELDIGDNNTCGEHKRENDGSTSQMVLALDAKTLSPTSNITERLQ